jgi:hypothetical protein
LLSVNGMSTQKYYQNSKEKKKEVFSSDLIVISIVNHQPKSNGSEYKRREFMKVYEEDDAIL